MERLSSPVSVLFLESVLLAVEALVGVNLAVLERVCLPPELRAFSIGKAALAYIHRKSGSMWCTVESRSKTTA